MHIYIYKETLSLIIYRLTSPYQISNEYVLYDPINKKTELCVTFISKRRLTANILQIRLVIYVSFYNIRVIQGDYYYKRAHLWIYNIN